MQALKDQEVAKEDQRQMKLLIADLVTDGIIPNDKGLHDLTLNAEGMTVNDKKQTDSVYSNYKEKYKRFAIGNFSYGDDGKSQYHGIHMSMSSDQ